MSNKLLKKHYNGHGLYRVIPDPRYLTLQTDGHGIISADALSGYSGDTITLSNTAHDGYLFSGYSVTGASLNGSTVTLNNQDATAKAWFEAARSAILYDNASEIKATTNGATAIKNINTPLTAYRYLGLNFDCILNVDAFNKNMYSTIVISGLRNVLDNHWTIRAGTYEWGYRYYCKGVRYASNNDGYISYNSNYVNNRAGGYYYLANGAYDGSGNPMPVDKLTTYKFVIDRKGDGISAYSIYDGNMYYLGQVSPSNNYNYCTAIHNIKITDNLDCPITAKNFKIAGFSDVASAIAWRG